jgi:hypothetical protein
LRTGPCPTAFAHAPSLFTCYLQIIYKQASYYFDGDPRPAEPTMTEEMTSLRTLLEKSAA